MVKAPALGARCGERLERVESLQRERTKRRRPGQGIGAEQGRKGAGQLVVTVSEQTALLPCLLLNMSDKGRNKVKAILTRGQVMVDGRVVTQHDYALQPGQTVRVNLYRPQQMDALHGLRIIYEDAYLLVVDKDAGLLTIATDEEKYATAYRQLQAYVEQAGEQQRIFVVHRLDRDTSGLLLFAKTETVKQALQNNWQEAVSERVYTVLVEGRVNQEAGVITSWLKETKTMLVYSSQRPGDGDRAVTHFTVLRAENHCSLLEARLETGRKNQIRVHMKDMGHPVVGDKRYGAAGNPLGRLGLHARVLEFVHPVTGEQLHFETPVPPPFLRFLDQVQGPRRRS